MLPREDAAAGEGARRRLHRDDGIWFLRDEKSAGRSHGDLLNAGVDLSVVSHSVHTFVCEELS